MHNPVARIMDANRNRAGEALRTLEEYARFVLNSPALSGRAKALRHELAEAFGVWTGADAAVPFPAAHRDIVGDAGADVKTPAEASRADAASVAAAAARRAAEALRALSEYGKIASPAAAAAFEKIRYGLYALEPRLLAGQALKQRLADARLYVLVTTSLSRADPLTTAREAALGGADIIQMREKDMEDGAFHELALRMAEVCREAGALLLINDRPHIASLVDAAGIHGGQGDLPVHLARRLIGPDRIIGVSTSEPALAEKALADGADYIGVGPVYETNTKQHRRAVGLEYVKWAAEWGRLPFFAIGSVNRETVDGVIGAGARAVAICTAVTRAADVAAETAFFKDRLLAAGK